MPDRVDIGPCTLILGDCLQVMPTLPAEFVNCCVTSPPYFGLRDYGHAAQIGLEPTPAEYVAKLVDVFRAVRRVLRDDGTLWLNLGDSYAGSGRGGYVGEKSGLQGSIDGQVQARVARGSQKPAGLHETARQGGAIGRAWTPPPAGFKSKDLIGIPWRVAFALQADGWYLRSDIIWHKPNPMPESVRDRPTKAHEYLFLLAKSERYYYDAEAIMEPLAGASVSRLLQANLENQRGSDRVPGKTNGRMKAVVNEAARKALRADTESRHRSSIPGGQSLLANPKPTRNRRSVWTVTTRPYKGAHFATFPPALIEPCILAGCPEGGTVLDPFSGAGTTPMVAVRTGRACVGIEVSPEYFQLETERVSAAWAAESVPLYAGK